MTFKEAYDKIIEAYFKDEIKPFEAEFCVCGTLHGSSCWQWAEDSPYSNLQYIKMEHALFRGIKEIDGRNWSAAEFVNSELAIFTGMSMAIDVLREIHESRGEVIEPFEFKKRELATA